MAELTNSFLLIIEAMRQPLTSTNALQAAEDMPVHAEYKMFIEPQPTTTQQPTLKKESKTFSIPLVHHCLQGLAPL